MPRKLLTDLSVRSLKGSAKNEKFFDTKLPGFGVRCGLKRKTWIVMTGRNRQLITIGHYPDLSLSDARTKAKKLLASDTQEESPKSYTEAKDEYLATLTGTSRWPHIVKLTFKREFKNLASKDVADITDKDVSKALDKIDGESARLHAYRILRTFFAWCSRPPRRYCRSPMEGYEPPSRDKKGSRTLTDDELKAVWNASKTGSRRIFQLLILWGTRSAETTGIERKWSSEGTLTIPGEHTKNGRDHSIPVLPLAKAVLDSRPNAGPYFFQGRYSYDTHLTAGALARMRAEIQAETETSGWQIRDIRRTFRSNMARLGVPRDLCELLLNHAPPVLDEIYDRYTYLAEKREALGRLESFMIALLA